MKQLLNFFKDNKELVAFAGVLITAIVAVLKRKQTIIHRHETSAGTLPGAQRATSAGPSAPHRSVDGRTAGAGLLAADQIVRAFDEVYPTKTAFDKQTFRPLLIRLGVPDVLLSRKQDEIRASLGTKNDATYLYGSRGDAAEPTYVERRHNACVVIADVINRP